MFAQLFTTIKKIRRLRRSSNMHGSSILGSIILRNTTVHGHHTNYTMYLVWATASLWYKWMYVCFLKTTKGLNQGKIYSNHNLACTLLNFVELFFQTSPSWSNSPSFVVERCRPKRIISTNACSLLCCESWRHGCCGNFTSERSWHFCQVIKGSKKQRI